ncbi:MAG: hypothetical protein JWO82_3371 [Akkermansiaceae bacterium]|nr:hypothetical protein [Akkermansiaceae bacterium]
MKNTTTIGIAALLVGGVGGYFTGKSGGNNALSSDMPNDALHDTKKVRPDSAGGSSTANAAARDKKVRSVGDIFATPGQSARIQALVELYAGMDANQLQAEADKLRLLPQNQRMMASILLFGRWGEVDPTGALEETKKMGQAGMFVKGTVLQSWASVDPVNAAKYFSENPREFSRMGGPGGGDNGASTIASEWAKLDPEAALSWANTLSNAADKGNALSSVVREIATKDPTKAAEIASGLTGEDQTRAYESIAQQWGSSDFSAAKAWINSLPADARNQAMASALQSYAATDPVKASQEVASLTGDSKTQAIENVAQAWARTDPAKAAAWVAEQGAGTGAMGEVMRSWATQDSSAALTFIQAQPQGELRDQAVGSYVWANNTGDPKASVALAESITNEQSRDRAIMASAGRWMQEDEAAAKTYIQNSNLNDRAKEMLLSGRQWGGGGRGGFGGGRGR